MGVGSGVSTREAGKSSVHPSLTAGAPSSWRGAGLPGAAPTQTGPTSHFWKSSPLSRNPALPHKGKTASMLTR